MSLRPIPDLTNDQAMSKLGRLSAIRNARADALHELRDACVEGFRTGPALTASGDCSHRGSN